MRAPSSKFGAEFKHLPVILGFCLMVAGGAGIAQVADQVPEPVKKASVYRVASSLVLVDAIVTDKNNRPVLNLSAHDFSIFEDGVPEALESFRVISPQSLIPAKTPDTSYRVTADDSDFTESLQAGKFVEDRQYMI